MRFVSQIAFGSSLVVERFRFGNGLTVLLLVDRTAPVISYHTWFRVGSRHEKPNKTGLAHLFEHLMFNETKNLPAGEFDRLLEVAGAETNAATWTDWTYYYENVPRSELELAVRLESDRLQNLVLHEPQVASEKEVVKNERRYRVDDDVEGSANETLYALSFRKHPYRWPTIGWMRDIESFTTADCLDFYSKYYAPNNATIIIAGDCDRESSLALVQKYYGAIPSARLPAVRAVQEPKQTSERRKSVKLPTASEKILVGYRAPGLGDRNWVTLNLLNQILFGGRSSRLYQKLVNDLEIATECQASITPFRDPGLYEIWISMREGLRSKGALKILDREIADVMKRYVTEEELVKAKNRLELGFLHELETASGKAEQVGFFESVTGRPEDVFARLERYQSVTAADIRRIAQSTLRPSGRSIVTVEPALQ